MTALSVRSIQNAKHSLVGYRYAVRILNSEKNGLSDEYGRFKRLCSRAIDGNNLCLGERRLIFLVVVGAPQPWRLDGNFTGQRLSERVYPLDFFG
jgi:hypothetical protein